MQGARGVVEGLLRVPVAPLGVLCEPSEGEEHGLPPVAVGARHDQLHLCDRHAEQQQGLVGEPLVKARVFGEGDLERAREQAVVRDGDGDEGAARLAHQQAQQPALVVPTPRAAGDGVEQRPVHLDRGRRQAERAQLAVRHLPLAARLGSAHAAQPEACKGLSAHGAIVLGAEARAEARVGEQLCQEGGGGGGPSEADQGGRERRAHGDAPLRPEEILESQRGWPVVVVAHRVEPSPLGKRPQQLLLRLRVRRGGGRAGRAVVGGALDGATGHLLATLEGGSHAGLLDG